MADCVPCHFEYEEEEIVPHLPPSVASWLLWDHARLKALGYPADQVLEHAEKEMAYFRRWAPAHMVAQVEADHTKLHPYLLEQARRAPSHTPPSRTVLHNPHRRTPSPSRSGKLYALVKQLLF